jgi:immune inhibitor A
MDRSEKTVIVILVSLLLIACCLLVLCGGFFYLITGSTGLFSGLAEIATPINGHIVAPTPTVKYPDANHLNPSTQPGPAMPGNADFSDTLLELQNAEIPNSDLVYLAERYEGKTGIPRQLTAEPVSYELGDRLDFYKLNMDDNTTDRITAVLRYASDKIYFWTEEGLDLDNNEIDRVLREFEQKIYPINQEFFGKEWIPGVDNDPHLYILYAGNMGFRLAGYTASPDTVLPQAHKYSNTHEMFYINSDVQWLSDPYTLSVMAHELQHLIHGYHDPNEELWLNEGFSELATLLNGYSAGGFDDIFAYNPDIQLNDWSVDPNENDAHYGASFLFVTYLLERFGEDFTKALVADEMDGFSSIDHVLASFDYQDTETGKSILADDVFVDWTITNFIDDTSFADGRYAYTIYQNAPNASATETITDCTNVQLQRDVHQYGADYIRLACSGQPVELDFSGSPTVEVLPIPTHEGYIMWSNRADASVTSMSHDFDFTGITGPITMEFDTWYDLEADYDYLYLIASQEGQPNRILRTSSCTYADTTGNSFGCGYNGTVSGWITESVNLTEFAGKQINLSFEYVTDEAVTADGFVLDNIRIPEIGYQTGFEDDNGGWKKEGFVRINNILPQTFLVSIIDTYHQKVIGKYALTSNETLQVKLDALPEDYDYILIVSGSSRYTRQLATYQIDLK